MEDVEIKSNIQSVIDLASTIGEPRIVEHQFNSSAPFVVVPFGYELKSIEHLLPYPSRARSNTVVTNDDSFIAYTKKHGNPDDCTIYASIKSESSALSLVAVLNDHTNNGPGWRDHLCTFAPETSVEWRRWNNMNTKQMNQACFATWIEDNLADIATITGMPTGAQMLEMALKFEANAEKRVASNINLQTGGMRFEYVDDEDRNTRVTMDAFSRFTIGIPVFEGSVDAYPVDARLKYRNNQGKLSFWYELIRPDRAFKAAVNESLNKIKESTGLLLIHGIA